MLTLCHSGSTALLSQIPCEVVQKFSNSKFTDLPILPWMITADTKLYVLCHLKLLKKSFPSVFTKFTTKKPQRDEGAKMTKCQNQWQRSSKNVCDHPHSPNLPKELKNKQTNKHILGLSKLQISYKVIRYSRDLGNKRG